jgi:DnaJ-class molecular chaperone
MDMLENCRPWHGLDLDQSTAKVDGIKNTFRQLAKPHHPDARDTSERVVAIKRR